MALSDRRRSGLKTAAIVAAGAGVIVAFALIRHHQGRKHYDLGGKRYLRVNETHVVFSATEKRTISGDPVAFYRQYRLTPVFVDQTSGRLAGADVSFLSSDSFLRLGGVAEGDRLLRINGNPVESVDTLTNLVGTISSSGSLSLVVLRDQNEHELLIEFQ